MKPLRYKVLFLASWYPSRLHPLMGIFVKRKASAMRRSCDVAVLHAADDVTLRTPYEVTISDDDGIPTVIAYFRPSTVPVLRGVVYNIRYFRAYHKGWKALKASWGQPDLFHVNVIDRAGYFALLMKWIRGFPYVITEHSTPDIRFLRGETASTKIPLRALKSLVIRHSSALNVDSQPSLEFLIKAGFTGNFCVIPNVVQMAEPAGAPSKRVGSKKLAVHISILNERKNVVDIIRTCASIWNTGRRDFEFHIVGEGEQSVMLKELARSLGVLDTCVIFRGRINDAEKELLLRQADFHVLNSDEEGFSVVTAESICCGTPVIATRCGGPEDFVTPEVGLLIERRDPEGLERAFRQMLDSSHTYDAEALRSYGRKRFGAETVAGMTYEMYRRSIIRWNAGNTRHPIAVRPEWSMLDVGSGHQPNRRANILLERYLEPTIHRTTQTVPLPSDKEMIVGDALRMPFADRSIDFVVASHIAEHVDDPVRFCAELQRVAKAGYIETPGPLTEYLMPTRSHKWIVWKRGTTIVFKKNPWSRSAFPSFFRFFYLNRDGYVENTMRSDHAVVKAMNVLLLKLWSHIPYAYMKCDWSNGISCVVVGERPEDAASQ